MSAAEEGIVLAPESATGWSRNNFQFFEGDVTEVPIINIIMGSPILILTILLFVVTTTGL